MTRLRCPYVVNLIGASHVEGKRCIVTELCKHGSVADLVFSDKNLNYLLVLKVALDMAKAIAFLHAYPPQNLRQGLLICCRNG
jgi:serine/threonine protein kinase